MSRFPVIAQVLSRIWFFLWLSWELLHTSVSSAGVGDKSLDEVSRFIRKEGGSPRLRQRAGKEVEDLTRRARNTTARGGLTRIGETELVLEPFQMKIGCSRS